MKNFLLLFVLMTSIQLNAQIIDFPDANFKNALINTKCVDTDGDKKGDADADTNNDGEIDEVEALAVTGLVLKSSQITSLEGIKKFKFIKLLNIQSNAIKNLDLTGLDSLEYLNCSGDYLHKLEISYLKHLTYLQCDLNQLTTLNLNGLYNLTTLRCHNNLLESLDLSGLNKLMTLECQQNMLDSIYLGENIHLETIYINENKLKNLDVSKLQELKSLNCSDNVIINININGLKKLEVFGCYNNQISTLNLSGLSGLKKLGVVQNKIKSIDFTDSPDLEVLSCDFNLLDTLDLHLLKNLDELYCSSNHLTNLDLSQNNKLTSLLCDDNQIKSLDVKNLKLLRNLGFSSNQLTDINVAGLTQLVGINCANNKLKNLDLQDFPEIFWLDCKSNELESIIYKTGRSSSSEIYFDFKGNPNLKYVCCDEVMVDTCRIQLIAEGNHACVVNSYCNFNPGGAYDIVIGKVLYSTNSINCDSTSQIANYVNLVISNGITEGKIYLKSQKEFINYLQAGNYAITPSNINQDAYTVVPDTLKLSLNGVGDTLYSNFCLIPKNEIHDVEVTIIPLGNIAPGFKSNYRILYTNKGNQIESGNITLNYNEPLLDFNNATPNPDIQNSGSLSWNYSSLLPFESRTILLSFQANKPTDTPPLNGGDILDFVASITGSDIDDTPEDNQFDLRQVVVNSLDPNDKTCLEGNRITPNMLGNYVHYLIRFENTGTFPAENIVVKDIIDTTRFDIRSLQIVDQSHPVWARILDGNRVEFIFEHIKLPFDDASNDGFVAFKIKTRKDLVLGDSLNNKAEIYFDYNFPIVTNEAQTTVEKTLFTQDFKENSIEIYPNPVTDILNFNTKEKLHSVEIYDLHGKQVRAFTNAQNNFNVKDLPAGMYWLQAHSVANIFYGKFVKM